MCRLPRIMGEQAIKAFAHAGFEVDRVKGAHHILKRDTDGVRLSIPVHQGKTLGLGLLRSLLRAADISVEEFSKLC